MSGYSLWLPKGAKMTPAEKRHYVREVLGHQMRLRLITCEEYERLHALGARSSLFSPPVDANTKINDFEWAYSQHRYRDNEERLAREIIGLKDPKEVADRIREWMRRRGEG